MHVVFEDVKEKSNDPRHRKKFQGVNFQEFLYADDTLVLAKNFRIANEYLHFSQNLKGEDEPFLHQLPSPRLRSKARNIFQNRHLSSSARGETPLHRAAQFGRDAVVERLLAAGANIDATDNEGCGLSTCHNQDQINQHMHANPNSFAWGCSPLPKDYSIYMHILHDLSERYVRFLIFGV